MGSVGWVGAATPHRAKPGAESAVSGRQCGPGLCNWARTRRRAPPAAAPPERSPLGPLACWRFGTRETGASFVMALNLSCRGPSGGGTSPRACLRGTTRGTEEMPAVWCISNPFLSQLFRVWRRRRRPAWQGAGLLGGRGLRYFQAKDWPAIGNATAPNGSSRTSAPPS